MATVRYTVLDGEILAQTRDGVKHNYVPDPLGSVVALYDTNQTKTDTFSYWPYGEEKSRTGTTATPFRFAGTAGYYSDSPQRTYLPARHFRQDQGRWQSAEPAPHVRPIAPYKYGFNSPCTFVDRTGNWPFVFPPNTVWPSDPRWPRLPDAIAVPDPRAVGKKSCIETARDNAYIIVGRYIWPKPGGHGGPEDAFRHCVWACLVRKTCGQEAYESGVIDHERPGAWWCSGKWSPVYSPQDLANDEVGHQCSSAKGSCESCCMDKLRSGGLYIMPPWFWQ